MGTWIEMSADVEIEESEEVVPYVGTWIEILSGRCNPISAIDVGPYVGTWIEILQIIYEGRHTMCRSLRGNVDRNNASSAVTL